ncbi:hypothetical protein JCM8097_000728 [Rhodosporidiobolus ruineniae]
MPPIEIDQHILPPSLLPVLHDCLHHRPPLWFAKLEELYQSINNIRPLSRSVYPLCAYYARKREKGRRRWWKRLVPGGKLAPGGRTSERDEMVTHKRRYCWYLLTEVRAAYVVHAALGVGIQDRAGRGSRFVQKLFELEDENDERVRKAMGKLPEVGLTTEQRHVFSCAYFQNTVTVGGNSGLSATKLHEQFGERCGGREEEWVCSSYLSYASAETYIAELGRV